MTKSLTQKQLLKVNIYKLINSESEEDTTELSTDRLEESNSTTALPEKRQEITNESEDVNEVKQTDPETQVPDRVEQEDLELKEQIDLKPDSSLDQGDYL